MIRAAFAAAALGTLAFGAPGVQAAEPIQLKFANPGAPGGHVSRKIITPFAERMTKDSNGTVEFKLFSGPSLGTFPVIYDRVINGVADLTFGLLGPISSQFPKTMVASLPFETPNATVGTQALWQVLSAGLIAEEWNRVKPLATMVFPNALFHAKKPIQSLADAAGLKYSVQSRLAAEAVQALGGAPITLAVTDLYQALQRGTVDAATIGWPATASYKLAEVSNYHLAVPIGSEITYMVMNKESYAKLPTEGKAAVDKNIGDHFAKSIGETLDQVDEEESSAIRAQPGQTIARLPPEEEARWQARVTPVTEAWAKSTPDGEKILATYRAAVAKIGKKP
jgi:TRAP-type C4-dicarboxylate transport system substrate-binding protein